MIFYEGIFRRPRLRTNIILKKHAHLFDGKIINVSGADDYDKDCTLKEYFFGNYDSGNKYKDYFLNADEYYITNYPNDKTNLNDNKKNLIYLDIEQDLPKKHINEYDVVFNHTVMEHVFDVFTGFKNLCLLSKDIVILIVPQFQKIHDYTRGYKDYWRFTPYSIEKLFEINDCTVIYREITGGFSESKYLYCIASKNPEKWEKHFKKNEPIEKILNYRNDGSLYTSVSFLQLKLEALLRYFFNRR